MTWHFDFILGKKSTNYLHLDMQDKQKIVKYNVKILNIFNLDVLNYQIDNLNDIKDISNQFNLSNGLYVINIYEKNILIYQEKLLLYK